MLIDVWDLPAISALGDELAFRIQAANVTETRLCSVGNPLKSEGPGRRIRQYVRLEFAREIR